jgi:Polysaccharide lyase
MQGAQLFADSGTWSGPSASYGYQWARCNTAGSACSPIAGSNGQTYTLTSSDVGSTLRVIVTATNKNGSALVVSPQTATINAASVTSSSTTTTATTTVSTAQSTTTTTPKATTITTTTPTTTTATTTTAGTTTTAQATAGTVLFNGNFETGNYSQWTWNAQCANTGTASDSTTTRGYFYAVSDIAAQGSYAGRFDLPADSTKKTGCEVLRQRTLRLNTDEFYALDVRFPTNWVEPDVGAGSGGWGLTFAQFNFQNIWAGPLQLVAHADNIRVILQTGACVFGSGCAYTSGNGGTVPIAYAVPPGQLTLGVWHQFVIHVRWAADSSGIVEVWHRQKGSSGWTRTAAYSNYPTVQWSPGGSPDTNQATADKEGAYRGPSSAALSIWHDGFCVATTFTAAESCL